MLAQQYGCFGSALTRRFSVSLHQPGNQGVRCAPDQDLADQVVVVVMMFVLPLTNQGDSAGAVDPRVAGSRLVLVDDCLHLTAMVAADEMFGHPMLGSHQE